MSHTKLAPGFNPFSNHGNPTPGVEGLHTNTSQTTLQEALGRVQMQYAYVSQLLSGLGLDGKKSNDKQKLKTQAINVRGPLYKSLLGARSVISSRMGNHPEAGHYADLYYMIDRTLSGRN